MNFETNPSNKIAVDPRGPAIILVLEVVLLGCFLCWKEGLGYEE